mmetsp:Transcript_26930/g.65386  ORF Transcript_26930/g.65386 Transcript_26930/m.65386 type:complete len:141 (+) Transcript_26930:2262-2684(+)
MHTLSTCTSALERKATQNSKMCALHTKKTETDSRSGYVGKEVVTDACRVSLPHHIHLQLAGDGSVLRNNLIMFVILTGKHKHTLVDFDQMRVIETCILHPQSRVQARHIMKAIRGRFPSQDLRESICSRVQSMAFPCKGG